MISVRFSTFTSCKRCGSNEFVKLKMPETGMWWIFCAECKRRISVRRRAA